MPKREHSRWLVGTKKLKIFFSFRRHVQIVAFSATFYISHTFNIIDESKLKLIISIRGWGDAKKNLLKYVNTRKIDTEVDFLFFFDYSLFSWCWIYFWNFFLSVRGEGVEIFFLWLVPSLGELVSLLSRIILHDITI